MLAHPKRKFCDDGSAGSTGVVTNTAGTTIEFSGANIAINYIVEDISANSVNISRGRVHFFNVCPPPPLFSAVHYKMFLTHKGKFWYCKLIRTYVLIAAKLAVRIYIAVCARELHTLSM